MYALYLLAEEGPNTSLSWLLWVVLAFFLVIVVVGWLVSRRRGDKPEPEPEVVEEIHEDKKPLDDLTKLEGIGPKVGQVLNKKADISSYADLARADPAKIQEILDKEGLQYMNPQGWIEQAKLAAKGDKEGLAKLQEELKGGRRVN